MPRPAPGAAPKQCPHCGDPCDVLIHAMDPNPRDALMHTAQHRTVHVQHSIWCNVRHEELRAKQLGYAPIVHDSALDRALHACAEPCIVVARAPWHSDEEDVRADVYTRELLGAPRSNDAYDAAAYPAAREAIRGVEVRPRRRPERQRLIWLRKSLIDYLLALPPPTDLPDELTRAKYWATAIICERTGGDSATLDAAAVLLALGEDLGLLTDSLGDVDI